MITALVVVLALGGVGCSDASSDKASRSDGAGGQAASADANLSRAGGGADGVSLARTGAVEVDPNEIVYTYSEAELQTVLASLKKSGRKYQDPIQRYKGLGEMDADQLATTTMDRAHRTLRRVNVGDAEMAAKVFELLMGNDVAPRKEFIIAGHGLDRDRIDV